MGIDETLSDVNERVNIRYPLNPPAQNHDSHVQRWENHKASQVLEWMAEQRYNERHGL